MQSQTFPPGPFPLDQISGHESGLNVGNYIWYYITTLKTIWSMIY